MAKTTAKRGRPAKRSNTKVAATKKTDAKATRKKQNHNNKNGGGKKSEPRRRKVMQKTVPTPPASPLPSDVPASAPPSTIITTKLKKIPAELSSACSKKLSLSGSNPGCGGGRPSRRCTNKKSYKDINDGDEIMSDTDTDSSSNSSISTKHSEPEIVAESKTRQNNNVKVTSKKITSKTTRKRTKQQTNRGRCPSSASKNSEASNEGNHGDVQKHTQGKWKSYGLDDPLLRLSQQVESGYDWRVAEVIDY